MWAGTCHSKEHSPKPEEPPKTISPQKVQSPQSKEKKKTVIVQMSRSLLINNRPLVDNLILRPDTPQSSESEDEPVAKKTVSPTEVTGQYRRTQCPSKCPSPEVTTVQFDHNYGNKKLRTDELGVQTPSDSGKFHLLIFYYIRDEVAILKCQIGLVQTFIILSRQINVVTSD